MFLYKNLFFFNIFCYFNPNHAYWNQWRLFSGNLPGMFGFEFLNQLTEFDDQRAIYVSICCGCFFSSIVRVAGAYFFDDKIR